MPIESHQTRIWWRVRLWAGRVYQRFETAEHIFWVNRARRFVNRRPISTGSPAAVAADRPSPPHVPDRLTAVATHLSPASSRHTNDPSAPWSSDDASPPG